MMIAHYLHRLPANYDVGLIRQRAKERAAEWDDEPDLVFKAFMLREAGQLGAIANSYSSLYLWRQDDAIRNFLVSGRYKGVTDTFGRADIQTASPSMRAKAPARMRGLSTRKRWIFRSTPTWRRTWPMRSNATKRSLCAPVS
jgi:Domain of unknown function (DUF4865)